MWIVLKRHFRGIWQQAKGDCPDRVNSDQNALRTIRWEACPCEPQPKALKTKLAQGGHQAVDHSDKMVLAMARGEAGPRERWPKTLQGELENNSRKPGDLVRKLAKWQPKKYSTYSCSEWEEEGRWCCRWWIWWCGENQCVKRLSDSDIVYWGIVPQHSKYIALSAYQKCQPWEEVDTDSHHETFSGPNWILKLLAGPHYG